MGAASASAQNSAIPQSSGSKSGGKTNSGNTVVPTTQSSVMGNSGIDAYESAFSYGQPELDARPQTTNQQPTGPQGKGGNQAGQPTNSGSIQSGSAQENQSYPDTPQLPTGSQLGWQYGQGANGRVTYPTTSGQQQFGQPMQGSTGSTAYSNTIGQQSNQSSGKGKGA